MKIKPFAGVRPPRELAEEVASRPYDVLNSVEAKQEAGEKSLLHIIKPEIDFDEYLSVKDFPKKVDTSKIIPPSNTFTTLHLAHFYNFKLVQKYYFFK